MLDTLIEQLKTLGNLPDLVLLGVILVSAGLGASRGLIRTVGNGVGRILALFGASAAAKLTAPILARFIVTPIVGQVFEVRAADVLSRSPALAQSLQMKATDLAAQMAQSLAFFLLFFIFTVVVNILVHMVSAALRLVTRIGPIGFLDSLGGFAVGAAFGLLLCFIGLWALTVFAPGVFGPLGWLAPEKAAQTQLTAFLLGRIPSL